MPSSYDDRMVFQRELTLHTHSAGEMHDLTDSVARIVSESGVRTGIAQIFNVGSTTAIGAIEFEPGLKQDLSALWRRLIPPAGTTPTSKPGTTVTAIPTCKQHCSVRA